MSITPRTLDTRLRSLERTKASHRGMIKIVNMQSFQDHYDNPSEPIHEFYVPDTEANRRYVLATRLKQVSDRKKQELKK